MCGETEIGSGNAEDVDVGGGGVGRVAKFEGCDEATDVGGGIDNDEELKKNSKCY